MVKTDEAEKEKMIDDFRKLSFKLDDICHEIWFTLMAKKKLRFIELKKSLKKFGTDIANPTLLKHLDHLINQGVIERKEEGFQTVTYGLTEKPRAILHDSKIDVKEWFEGIKSRIESYGGLKIQKIELKDYFAKLTEKDLNREIDRDISSFLVENLHSLKNFVNYDLKLGKTESYEDFWNFIGNPFFRMLEKMISENCRESERYKSRLFEKISNSTGIINKSQKPPKFHIFQNSKNKSK